MLVLIHIRMFTIPFIENSTTSANNAIRIPPVKRINKAEISCKPITLAFRDFEPLFLGQCLLCQYLAMPVSSAWSILECNIWEIL